MKVKIKVCGMRDSENIREVAERYPDYMGFIFYKKSPRYVGDEFVIPERFPDSIQRVGVFVNEELTRTMELARKNRLSFVQLHGSESVEHCKELQSAGLKVVKVFGIDDDFDFEQLSPYVGVVDYFLFDTKTEKFGGSGKNFNWDLLTKYPYQVPYFLSGGLNAQNVSQLDLTLPHLYALDFNSGIERSPGIKDMTRLYELTTNLKKRV